MFLSYAVVPVFTFTIMLNFLYMYPSIESLQTSENFTSCETCMNSTCYVTMNGTCTLAADNCTVQCLSCPPDPSGNQQFNKEEDCKASCQSPLQCSCDGACYICADPAVIDPATLQCALPTQEFSPNCSLVPYNMSTNIVS